jgi:hypothetical protein
MSITVDLGKVKFTWKGAYGTSTTYVKDDIVEYGGSSWVCVAASINNSNPSATNTNWNLMAQGGDPASIMSTQGDLLVTGAAGLEAIGVGTAGQKLMSNGTAPEWQDDVSGLTLKKRTVYNPTPGITTVTEGYNWYGVVYVDYTPTYATAPGNKIIASFSFQKGAATGYGMLHGRYYKGSTEILKRSWAANDRDDDGVHFVHAHDGYSGQERLGWKFRSYSSGHRPYLHRSYHYDGGAGSNYAAPQYIIEEWI